MKLTGHQEDIILQLAIQEEVPNALQVLREVRSIVEAEERKLYDREIEAITLRHIKDKYNPDTRLLTDTQDLLRMRHSKLMSYYEPEKDRHE